MLLRINPQVTKEISYQQSTKHTSWGNCAFTSRIRNTSQPWF